jgi:hypothetical protein
VSVLRDLLLPSRRARQTLTARQRALVYAAPAVLAAGLLILLGIVLVSAAGYSFSLPSFVPPALGVVITLSLFGSIGTKAWAEVTAAATDSPQDRSRRNRAILLGSAMGMLMPLAVVAFAALALGFRGGLGCLQLRIVYVAIGVFLLLLSGARTFHSYATEQGRNFRTRVGWPGQLVAILTLLYFALGLLVLAVAATTRC